MLLVAAQPRQVISSAKVDFLHNLTLTIKPNVTKGSLDITGLNLKRYQLCWEPHTYRLKLLSLGLSLCLLGDSIYISWPLSTNLAAIGNF